MKIKMLLVDSLLYVVLKIEEPVTHGKAGNLANLPRRNKANVEYHFSVTDISVYLTTVLCMLFKLAATLTLKNQSCVEFFLAFIMALACLTTAWESLLQEVSFRFDTASTKLSPVCVATSRLCPPLHLLYS